MHEYLLDHVYAGFACYPDRKQYHSLVCEAVFGPDALPEDGSQHMLDGVGWTRWPTVDQRGWYQVPITLANKATSTYTTPGLVDHPEVQWGDDHVHFPEDILDDGLDEYITAPIVGIGPQLRRAFQRVYSGARLTPILNSMGRVGNRVKELDTLGRPDVLYFTGQYDPKLEAVLKAVATAPQSMAALGEELLAREILEAIRWYKEQPGAECGDGLQEEVITIAQELLTPLTTPRQVGNRIDSYTGHEDVSKVDLSDWESSKYVLKYSAPCGSAPECALTSV